MSFIDAVVMTVFNTVVCLCLPLLLSGIKTGYTETKKSDRQFETETASAEIIAPFLITEVLE